MQAKKSRLKKVLLILSVVTCVIFALLGTTFAIVYNSYSLDESKLTSVNNGIRVTSEIGDDNSLFNTNRSIVEIDSLPKYVLDAFIDTEDKRFYSHHGYDFKRIVKATMVNLTRKSKSQGASTISQQLVKNALLSNEKTFSRKIKELVLSHKMERKFSKEEILEMYLNTIYFGSNAYGIENASKIYFDKSASQLTLNEACCLAGMIKSPNLYSPRTHKENCIARKNLVAKNMLEAGHITNEEYEEVLNQEIEITINSNYDRSYEEEAIFEACKLLNITERELINKNYQIVTFKDDNLQKEIISLNNAVINASENQYDADLDSVSIVADIDGHIKAYYVNSPYNLHGMKRQPASTLKPLAVYLPCITHNILTPSTQILDEEINYGGFSPKNADGKYHGYVTTRDAISKSLNVPAVKALEYVGIVKAKETLNDLGILLSKDDLNLSLALGSVSSGIELNQLLTAYSCIANIGQYKPLSFVSKILDENGNIIYSHEDYRPQVLQKEDCFILTDMLKETATSGTARRLNSLNIPVASKTGTAYDGTNNTDLYNVSYTSEHSVLTWIAGIKDKKLPDKMLSSAEPTEINKQILAYLYKNKKPADFKKPEGVERMAFDSVEAEENHRIVAPLTNKERYIKYDYFKISNPPLQINAKDDVNFSVDLSRAGANINFNAKKFNSYSVFKQIDGKQTLLREVKDCSEHITFVDNDVFKSDEISYIIKINDDEFKQVKVRPKDYLINLFNNEIKGGKRKWYV